MVWESIWVIKCHPEEREHVGIQLLLESLDCDGRLRLPRNDGLFRAPWRMTTCAPHNTLSFLHHNITILEGQDYCSSFTRRTFNIKYAAH